MQSCLKSHWRDSQPKLHALVAEIANFISDEKLRAEWLRILEEYPAEVKASESAKAAWREEKRRFIERDIFEAENEHLRDRSLELDGDFVPRDQGPLRLTKAQYDALPDHVRGASFRITAPESKCREDIRCYQPARIGGKRSFIFYMAFWLPTRLDQFDVALRVHDPLPPQSIAGRATGSDRYSLAEICHALTVLHDFDGAFGNLVDRGHSLYHVLRHEMSLLDSGIAANAGDSWVDDLKPLAKRLFNSLSQCSIAGSVWDEHTIARAAWVYDQRMAGVKLQTIVNGISRECASWEPLTISGINHVAREYAIRFNRPLPVPRKKGRPTDKSGPEKLK